MPRPIAEVSSDLDRLTLLDFDWSREDADGRDRLWALCDELRELDDVATVARLAFTLMERLHEADLGTPGPLVHELERRTGYEPFLEASVRRTPTPLTVWMVNRIVNAGDPDSRWRNLLRLAAEHPLANDLAKSEAMDFLRFQEQPE